MTLATDGHFDFIGTDLRNLVDATTDDDRAVSTARDLLGYAQADGAGDNVGVALVRR